MSAGAGRKRVLGFVVVGVALASAGFLTGFGYTVTTLVEPVGSQSATDPVLLATIQSSARIQAELHEEMAALRRDLGVRDRRASRASAAEAAAPTSRAETPPAAVARQPARLPSARPELTSPQEKKLHADLLAAARNEKDAGKRAAALRALAHRFGSEAPEDPSSIAGPTAQPNPARDPASNLGRQRQEGSK